MGRWLAVALLALLVMLEGPAWAQQKIALVIGISDYKVGGVLPQTLIDARKISAARAVR